MANVEIKHSINITDIRGGYISRLISVSVYLLVLAFCIWLSKGSVFWTAISGFLFIFFSFSLARGFVRDKSKDFTSFDDVIAWAEAKKRAEVIEEA